MDSEDLKARLFKPRVEEGEVTIPGVGTVRVRGLTRHEVGAAQQRAGDGLPFERAMLALGMVDPPLTETEVGQWQRVAPAGELEPVARQIQELSGLYEGASKSDVPKDGDESGAGV